MLRFICFILGRPYETCKSCETLKQQLAYEREEKQRLTDTLLSIINPKVVQQQIPVEITPIAQSSGVFGRRRAAMEARDRHEASLLREAKHLGRPDNLKDDEIDKKIETLEKELEIPQTETAQEV